MTDDTLLPFNPPAVARKKVTAAFDGGRITSDGGVMLLAQAERRLGIADRLAAMIPDGRDASRVIHRLADILRARIFAIACGYEDGDDLDLLRSDPAFKLACGRLPDTGDDLCSQPTVSRWENAPSLRDLIRLMGVMVDLYFAPGPPHRGSVDAGRSVNNGAVIAPPALSRKAPAPTPELDRSGETDASDPLVLSVADAAVGLPAGTLTNKCGWCRRGSFSSGLLRFARND